MTLGWAIIGIGRLADDYIAPAISRHTGSRLVAVCSRSRSRALAFAERHGAPVAYDDFAEMLADPGVDVVYVATPNGLHRHHVLAALEAGHHVLVDKPMTVSVADGRELVAAADAHERRLGVAFQLRHKATNSAARELIGSGRLGTPRVAGIFMGAGRAIFPYDTWRADPALAGGGTMLNQATHAIDLLRYLAGREISAVTCATSAPELEDVVVATCELEGGLLATLSTHNLRPAPRRDWHVISQEGWLEGRGSLNAAAGDELVLHTDDGESVVATSSTSAYDAEVEAFADAVAGTGDLNGDGVDGLRNAAVVEALYRSAREGRRVAVE